MFSAIRRIPLTKVAFTGAALASTAYVAHNNRHVFFTSNNTQNALFHAEETATKVPYQGIPGTKHERTFLMIKPDGVQRQLVGKIIKKMEEKGYVLVGLKMLEPSHELASQHYDDLKGRPFFTGLVDYMSSSGPVVAMVWEGKGVVKYSRVLIGETNPLTSNPGTIRGSYSVDIGRNTIHGSDSTENAQTEIALWFKPEEVVSWEPAQNKWVYEK